MFYAFHGSFLVFFSWFCCPRSITTYDSSDLKLYPLSVSILILFNSIYCLGFLVHFRLLSLSTIGEISSILLHPLNSCYQCELLDNFLSACKGLIVHIFYMFLDEYISYGEPSKALCIADAPHFQCIIK
ncbi:uncharacterized protein C8R40DRAFT_473183 [Lentinula edodes]|uniref:uncharacterized protein n=1 Tax=Lentinula edodes TaxID=5353 RepID=UPI001E8EA184|nr:uncharacterized protein C8R40DRAFT_473183 [Lentinula edodes]KAH7872587.1 hypothetical protein C8R40DRAFT_473183 [Lentinula edodes]